MQLYWQAFGSDSRDQVRKYAFVHTQLVRLGIGRVVGRHHSLSQPFADGSTQHGQRGVDIRSTVVDSRKCVTVNVDPSFHDASADPADVHGIADIAQSTRIIFDGGPGDDESCTGLDFLPCRVRVTNAAPHDDGDIDIRGNRLHHASVYRLLRATTRLQIDHSHAQILCRQSVGHRDVSFGSWNRPGRAHVLGRCECARFNQHVGRSDDFNTVFFQDRCRTNLLSDQQLRISAADHRQEQNRISIGHDLTGIARKGDDGNIDDFVEPIEKRRIARRRQHETRADKDGIRPGRRASFGTLGQVFEGQPWTIRRIHIAGNTKTREKVIRREVELRPGDVYKQNLVQESQRRIYMLNFFRDVQLQPEYSPVEGERYVDLTFQVEERPTGQASMGAGYSDRDKLVGQIGLQIPNFRGLGQNLDFSWEFGTRREQFLVGFTEPWLFDTPTSLAVRVYTLNQNYYDYYDYRRDAISVRVGRRLRKPAYSSLSMGYRLENSNYSDFSSEYASLSDESRYQPRTTSTFDMTYQRDTRDLAQFATRGTLFSYKPEIASSLVAGDVDFHRHEVGFNYYHPSWWKFVLSLETKVAVVDGFSKFDNDNIPFWERFTPGGVDWWDGQVRGYPDQSLGPRQSGIPIGGNSMMVLNLEYRFPLAEQQVYGLLFADAGNAWAKIGDISPLDLRRSVGFGFRVMTPMLGMIGFDFGYGFDRRKVDGAQAGWSTHFQFGPQFF